MSDNLTHVLTATNAKGERFFWTGGAGSRWVSAEYPDAFLCTPFHAERKARDFNQMTSVHGLTFAAVARENV